jgi:hypothetical protein
MRQVTRTRYEQPASAGRPTSLPRINTFIVLPRPPGISSIFQREPLAKDLFLVERFETISS